MSTTTTIYPTIDTRLAQAAPTTNYGTWTVIKIGYATSTSTFDNGIFEFDVSGYNPSDITEATFTIVQTAEWGSNARPMTLGRLTQGFTESTANWNTYDGSNAWTTLGGEGATDEPTYTMYVGDSSGDQSADIKELVIDAINKRAGVLRLIIWMESVPASSAIANYGSSENITPANRPSLAIKVAERIVWEGDRNEDWSDSRNWVGGFLPTSDDYALFTSGTKNVTSGALECYSLYVGKKYRGDIGTPSAKVDLQAVECAFNSAYSDINIELNQAISTVCDVRISDTARGVSSFRLNGKYNATIRRTRSDISLLTGDTTRIDAHSPAGTFTCSDDVNTVRITRAFATLEDGATKLTVADRGFARVERVNFDDTDIDIAGRSNVRCLAETSGTIIIYDGVIKFMGNEGAPVSIGGLYVYGNGKADTRTGAAAFTMGAAARMYGGRLLLDGSTSVAIA